jgi:hypothetical protein
LEEYTDDQDFVLVANGDAAVAFEQSGVSAAAMIVAEQCLFMGHPLTPEDDAEDPTVEDMEATRQLGMLTDAEQLLRTGAYEVWYAEDSSEWERYDMHHRVSGRELKELEATRMATILASRQTRRVPDSDDDDSGDDGSDGDEGNTDDNE